MIIIAGPAGAGKTTLAKMIAEQAFELGFIPELLSFAGALKDKAKKMGFDKETHPKQYRKFCQEEGKSKRDTNPNYWVNEFKKKLDTVISKESSDLNDNKKYWERCVIVDDCRYPNEVEFGLSNKATMLFISYGDRKNPRKNEEWMNHESEELNKIVDEKPEKFSAVFPYILDNNGTIEDLSIVAQDMTATWCNVEDAEVQNKIKKISQCVEELIDLLFLDSLEEDEEDDDENFKHGAD